MLLNHRGAGAYASGHWMEENTLDRSPVHHRADTKTYTFTPRGDLVSPIGLTACLCGRKPTQTPHRKDPGRPAGKTNPGPSSTVIGYFKILS